MSQDIINEHLQREINREVMIKRAVEKVEGRKAEERKAAAAARRRIEILQERKRLEDEYLCDYE